MLTSAKQNIGVDLLGGCNHFLVLLSPYFIDSLEAKILAFLAAACMCVCVWGGCKEIKSRDNREVMTKQRHNNGDHPNGTVDTHVSLNSIHSLLFPPI